MIKTGTTYENGKRADSKSGVRLGNNIGKRRIFFRIIRRIVLGSVRRLQYLLPQGFCMRLVVKTLRSYGMQFKGQPIYISPTCWFDGTDYSLIKIEDRVVLSSNVSILTHDFSLARSIEAITGIAAKVEVVQVYPVRIGRNSFVGRGSILMPGADIGENCIVAAGSVVRGTIPDWSLVVGNPARVNGNAREWGMAKMKALGLLQDTPEVAA